jgi:hypothetical protein
MATDKQTFGVPKFEFPTFDANNYRTWAHMCQVFFIEHGVWDIVDGSELNPAGNVIPRAIDGKL